MSHVLIPTVDRFRTVYRCECGVAIAWVPIEYLRDDEVLDRVKQRHREHLGMVESHCSMLDCADTNL